MSSQHTDSRLRATAKPVHTSHAGNTVDKLDSIPPLFLREKDLTRKLSAFELCSCITRMISPAKLEGVQQIGGLWRIYIKDKATKLELFCRKTVLIDGKHVPLYDQNPTLYHHNTVGMQHLPVLNDKLTIRNLPLSVSNTEVKQFLVNNNIQLRSDVKYGYIRDQEGLLTSFKSGDRFVYTAPFDPPLPRKQVICDIPCLVLHHGKDEACKACGISGHNVGDIICKAKPCESAVVFKGYEHPLSNSFPCTIHAYDTSFKSIEHAYNWRMAMEFGKVDLAQHIKNSRHAGEARHLANDITDEANRFSWSQNNIDCMKHLLQQKVEQCEQFRECLLENRGKILAEAGTHKLWSSGFGPYITMNCSQEYWPGQNMLGALLIEVTEELFLNMELSTDPSTSASASASVLSAASATVPQVASATGTTLASALVLQSASARVPPAVPATVPPSSSATDTPAASATVPPTSSATDTPAAYATVPPASSATDTPAVSATVPQASSETDPPASSATGFFASSAKNHSDQLTKTQSAEHRSSRTKKRSPAKIRSDSLPASTSAKKSNSGNKPKNKNIIFTPNQDIRKAFENKRKIRTSPDDVSIQKVRKPDLSDNDT